ncbi:DUF2637 domain-containing protein [Kitasatospora sp. NPDC092948]|uniref:DUF2637 domain-containing protein n=1 Tax=Kitasatospora sp. NPDC092948 TaxID=3364088 RepID=UPI00382BA102
MAEKIRTLRDRRKSVKRHNYDKAPSKCRALASGPMKWWNGSANRRTALTRPTINRGHKALIGVIVFGVMVIAAIGFAGSYKAVVSLAEKEGFGWFARVLPVGVDAGIVVLYAFELLLTWLRMPYPLLRRTAWLLTVSTIVMNSASAWGRPLAMAMHAVVPVLFVIVVEAARHAVARWASLEAGKPAKEGFDAGRWLNDPFGTLGMWRRKHLWGITSNVELLQLEKNRRILRRMLKKKYGRKWRKKSSELAQLLFSMAAYGEGDPAMYEDALAELGISLYSRRSADTRPSVTADLSSRELPSTAAIAVSSSAMPVAADVHGELEPAPGSAKQSSRDGANRQPVATAPIPAEPQPPAPSAAPVPGAIAAAPQQIPQAPTLPDRVSAVPVIVPETVENVPAPRPEPEFVSDEWSQAPVVEILAELDPEPQADPLPLQPGPELAAEDPDGSDVDGLKPRARVLYGYYVAYVDRFGSYPSKEQFVQWMFDAYGEKGQTGQPLSTESVKRYWLSITDLYRRRYETPQTDLLQMAGAGG